MSKKPIELAKDYTVAFTVPSSEYFIHDPGMAVLPDGSYLVFSPLWSRKKTDGEDTVPQVKNFQIENQRLRKAERVVISKSSDKGKTWSEISSIPFAEATPIVMEKDIYLFTQHYQHEAVYFTVSHDGGYTWEDPVKVIDRPLWNCQNSMVIKDDKLYWCLDEGHKRLSVICCNLTKGIMNPDAWRYTETITLPNIPDELVSGVASMGWNSTWPGGYALLEANTVQVNGRLFALARVVMDEYATANLCAVFEVIDDKDGFYMKFRQYYPLPGGQCKFNIIRDEVSGMFWMASNLPTNSQNLLDYYDMLMKTEFMGGPGNERRILVLWYSIDALNWIPAGIVAKADTMLQSFMYPSMDIDGDDLVILSRTSMNSGSQHDADRSTVHVVSNFRDLALSLDPKIQK